MKKKTTIKVTGPEPCDLCGETHTPDDAGMALMLRDFPTLGMDKVRNELNSIAAGVLKDMEERKGFGIAVKVASYIEDLKEQVKERIYDKLTPEEIGNALIESLTTNIGGMVSVAIDDANTRTRGMAALQMVHDAIGEHLHDPAQPKVTDPFPER